jgi:hypothetical protein
MSNAWFYYVFPLFISTVFVVFGLLMFRGFARGDRDTKGDKYGPGVACGGILFTAVGGTFGVGILLTSPTPWERQRLFDRVFRMPPERIERFVIKPGRQDQYQPLTMSQVVIDDRARIRQIAEALRGGREISPNHPRTKWTATVEMVTRDGKYCFGVDATVPGDANGTLVNASSEPEGGGWNLGHVRANGLETALEDAVSAVGTP